MITVGVDIVEISRFQEAQYLDRVSEFFLTPHEISLVPEGQKKYEYLAARFAAKEAVVKAMPDTVEYYEFEILKNGKKPVVKFLNSKYANYTASVSLTHSLSQAAAFVLVEH